MVPVSITNLGGQIFADCTLGVLYVDTTPHRPIPSALTCQSSQLQRVWSFMHAQAAVALVTSHATHLQLYGHPSTSLQLMQNGLNRVGRCITPRRYQYPDRKHHKRGDKTERRCLFCGSGPSRLTLIASRTMAPSFPAPASPQGPAPISNTTPTEYDPNIAV